MMNVMVMLKCYELCIIKFVIMVCYAGYCEYVRLE